MEKSTLLIDQLGEGDNVFESFASILEQNELEGKGGSSLDEIRIRISLVERRLQDLSERVTPMHQGSNNIYDLTINRTKKYLSFYLPILLKITASPQASESFINELDNLINYLDLDKFESKSIRQIEQDFDTKFVIKVSNIDAIKNLYIEIKPILSEENSALGEKLSQIISNDLYDSVLHILYQHKTNVVIKQKLVKSMIERLSSRINDLTQKENVNPEDIVYTGELTLWINTNDAAEANRFVSIVSTALSSIENVKLEIIDSGIGSYWQKVKLRIKGWFAREETKQILDKTIEAAQAYAVERYVEPIKKSKIERQLAEEEIKRMIPVAHAGELHNIRLEKEKQELLGLKLDNMNKRIDFYSKLSSAFATGLISIDSDFRIELDGLLLIKKENGELKYGDTEGLDFRIEKELPSPESNEGEESI